MDVSLKKAADLAKQLTTALQNLDFEPSMTVSIYADELVNETDHDGRQKLIADAEQKLRDHVTFVTQYNRCIYWLRAALAEQNFRRGVHAKVGTRAMLSSEINRLSTVLTKARETKALISDMDMRTIMRKAQAMRDNPSENRYGYRDDLIAVRVVPDGMISNLESKIRALEIAKQELDEELTLANVTNKISLEAWVLDCLKSANLLGV